MSKFESVATLLEYQQRTLLYTFTRKDASIAFLERILRLLFPHLPPERLPGSTEIASLCDTAERELKIILSELTPGREAGIAEAFVRALPEIQALLVLDVQATYDGDPAAKSHEEVILSYPGLYAIAVHRIAHFFYGADVPFLPRVLSEHAHSKTGIDIHPGARIGRSFCIDHGTGVVVGETTEIADNVKIYQGVTLGALSVQKDMCSRKRHPTVEDGVVIYANATILGGSTVIGKGSIIGGNVWVTESVAAGSKVYRKAEIES